MKATFLVFGFAMLFSCNNIPPDNSRITKDEMLSIVRKCDEQFRSGVQKRDSAIIVNCYGDSARYIVPNYSIMRGKSEIGKAWADFIRLKEKPIDMILYIDGVNGNRETIYETGRGYTLLADSSKWAFNYVNVWQLQKDGSYKLIIDIYN